MCQIEIKGLAEPKSKEATRICQEDLNEVIATFAQDKPTIKCGLFDEELVPEELKQVRACSKRAGLHAYDHADVARIRVKYSAKVRSWRAGKTH